MFIIGPLWLIGILWFIHYACTGKHRERAAKAARLQAELLAVASVPDRKAEYWHAQPALPENERCQEAAIAVVEKRNTRWGLCLIVGAVVVLIFIGDMPD